jgi:hypothetical protein
MPALKFDLKEVCVEGLTFFPCRAASRTAEDARHVERNADAQSVRCSTDVQSRRAMMKIEKPENPIFPQRLQPRHRHAAGVLDDVALRILPDQVQGGLKRRVDWLDFMRTK